MQRGGAKREGRNRKGRIQKRWVREKKDGLRYRRSGTDLEGEGRSKERRKEQGSDGEKESDRDRVRLKEMEAEMKEQEGRTDMESSEDWFDLAVVFFPPLPVSPSLPPPVFLHLLYIQPGLPRLSSPKKKSAPLEASRPLSRLANCGGITVSND